MRLVTRGTSVRFCFGSPFSSKAAVCGHCLVTFCPSQFQNNIKMALICHILMQESFWWWQCSRTLSTLKHWRWTACNPVTQQLTYFQKETAVIDIFFSNNIHHNIHEPEKNPRIENWMCGSDWSLVSYNYKMHNFDKNPNGTFTLIKSTKVTLALSTHSPSTRCCRSPCVSSLTFTKLVKVTLAVSAHSSSTSWLRSLWLCQPTHLNKLVMVTLAVSAHSPSTNWLRSHWLCQLTHLQQVGYGHLGCVSSFTSTSWLKSPWLCQLTHLQQAG